MNEFYVVAVLESGARTDLMIEATPETTDRIYQNRGEKEVLELEITVGDRVIKTCAHNLFTVN